MSCDIGYQTDKTSDITLDYIDNYRYILRGGL